MFKYFLQAGDEIGESHIDTSLEVMHWASLIVSAALLVFFVWLIVKVVRIIIRHDKPNRNTMPVAIAIIVLVGLTSCKKEATIPVRQFTDKERELLIAIGVDPETVHPAISSIKPYEAASIEDARKWYSAINKVRDKSKSYANKEEVTEMPDDEVDNDTGVGAGSGSGGSTGGDNSSTTAGSGGGTTNGTADDLLLSNAEATVADGLDAMGNPLKTYVVRMSKWLTTGNLNVSLRYTKDEKGQVNSISDAKVDYAGFTHGMEWRQVNEGYEVTPKGYIKLTIFGDEVYAASVEGSKTSWAQPITIIALFDPVKSTYSINIFKGKMTGIEGN